MPNTGKQQSSQLPVTSSSEIVESKGLAGIMVLVVLISFVAINQFLSLFGVKNGPPISAFACGILWFGFNLWLRDKPPAFIPHLFQYWIIPKTYTHFSKAKENILTE